MNRNVINLRADQTAVVGYGSLLLSTSITRLFGRVYDGPFLRCWLPGWRRSWNIAMPNVAFYYEEDGIRIYPRKIIYLNVRPSEATTLNCSVLVVSNHELELLHQWEWVYQPVDVGHMLHGVQVKGGRAILYVGRPEHFLQDVTERREAAVRGSYVTILETALAAGGRQFRREYGESTDPVPKQLVIDDLFDGDKPNPWAPAGLSYSPGD